MADSGHSWSSLGMADLASLEATFCSVTLKGSHSVDLQPMSVDPRIFWHGHSVLRCDDSVVLRPHNSRPDQERSATPGPATNCLSCLASLGGGCSFFFLLRFSPSGKGLYFLFSTPLFLEDWREVWMMMTCFSYLTRRRSKLRFCGETERPLDFIQSK